MQLDPWTAETLRQMVAYVADDDRIAVYLDIPLREVAAARRRRGPGRRPAKLDDEPSEEPDRWERDLRQGSQRLAEAIAESRG